MSSDGSQPDQAPATTPVQTKAPTYASDWTGPDDPGNPMNWSVPKKTFHTVVPAGVAFVTTLATSIYAPGINSVKQEFGVSEEVALLPYSLYVVGLAFGPMIAAPCSETFGRKIVYQVGVLGFALFILGAGFANDIAALTVCRFFAGFFGSPGLSAGSATLSEIWVPAQRALPMTLYILTPFLGPAIGPLIGGAATQSFNWRWTEWSLLFATVVCGAPLLFIQETYKKVILRRRADKLGLPPPADAQRTTVQALRFFLKSTLTRPVHMALVEPVVGLFALYVGINFGMLYCFVISFAYVFETIYGFGLVATGLTFLGFGAGNIIGCGVVVGFSHLTYRRQVARSIETGRGGKVPPEERLYIAMIGSALLPVGLFWFGWSAEQQVSWVSPVIAEAFFGCGNLLIFMASVLYVMDFYGPLYGASAMGANNLFRYMLGAVFSLVSFRLYVNLGVGWASSLLGFLSLVMMPIPWAFYVWGPRLRSVSKYAPKA